MVGKFLRFFPTIGTNFRPFSNDWKKFGSSGIIVDGADFREIMERYLENGECASILPPPRGGCRPEEDGLWIASAEWKERAAGGVLRGAVDAGFRMVHPQRDWFVSCRWKVVLAATANRSTPPVAAPAACLLPCIILPFMAAPPPSRRGAGPPALLAPCIRGVPWVVPLHSPECQTCESMNLRSTGNISVMPVRAPGVRSPSPFREGGAARRMPGDRVAQGEPKNSAAGGVPQAARSLPSGFEKPPLTCMSRD